MIKMMNRISLEFRKGLAAAAIVLFPQLSAGESPPNIVFIMADDLGWQDVGFMGSDYFETPHLDALAEAGMIFDNAFMYPTCSPSRAALLTGQHSFRTGVYTVPVLERGTAEDNIFSKWTVGREHSVYAEPLRDAGYKLIHLGKWHIVGPNPAEESVLPLAQKILQPPNGDLSWLPTHKSADLQSYYPTGRGFHANVGGTWWGDPARGYDEGYAAPSGGYVAPFKNPFIDAKDTDGWLTDRLTDEAIDFIDRHRSAPFFINLHYYSPHRPTVIHDEASMRHFMAKPADPVTGQGRGDREEIAAYATMVKSLDDNVKRLVDFLDATGLRENTVVIFTSDNGFNGLQSRNENLRGAKGNVYDGGLRVPAFANWPGRVAPQRRDETVHVLDYFPTFLDLAGVENHAGPLDGESLLPLLSGDSMATRSVYWHIASTYKDPPCSILRRGPWKLIQFLKDGRIELYNTATDIKEVEDLSHSHPEMARSLLRELQDWRRQNHVPLPPSSILERS